MQKAQSTKERLISARYESRRAVEIACEIIEMQALKARINKIQSELDTAKWVRS